MQFTLLSVKQYAHPRVSMADNYVITLKVVNIFFHN